MKNPFIYIYRFFRRRRPVFISALVVSFLVTGWLALHIKPEEDISKILPDNRSSVKFNQVLHNARFADKLVVMVSMRDSAAFFPDSLALYADSFATHIRSRNPGLVRAVDEKINDSLAPQMAGWILENLPVFLEPADYRNFDSLDNQEKISGFLLRDLQSLSSPSSVFTKTLISQDPLGISYPAFKKLRQLQYDDNFDLYEGHVVTKDGKYLLLFVEPAYPPDNTLKNDELLQGLDQVTASMGTGNFKNIQSAYFGGIAVAVANAKQLRYDSILTLSITAVFLICFLAWYFKRKRAPFIILVPVLLGAVFSLALMYLIRGSISVIALAAGSIVLGIAINYSLHVYNHCRHRKDMELVLNDLSFPLTIGSLTTIGGFLCLQFVQSDILKDLGLFAAFSLIGASLSSLIFLPHLIAAEKNTKVKKQTERDSWISRLSDYHPEKNKWLIGLIFLLTIVFAFFVHRVQFDQDLMHMNYMPARLTSAEADLNKINAFSLRSVYLVTDGTDLQSALKKQEAVNKKIDALHAGNRIKKYSGVFHLLISDSLQDQRIAYWKNYWTAEKKDALLKRLARTGDSLGFRPGAFERFRQILEKSYQPLSPEQWKMFRRQFADDYIMHDSGQTSLITLLRVEPEEKEYVFQTFSSDADVTVIDRQHYTSTLLGAVTADFNQIGWMVSIMVFIVLLLTYGRIELALISFIPMAIAFIWILGIMGMAGLQFNIVNIILSALIFGLGDDYSLFIMDGLLQEYKTGKQNLASYKSSIVLSAITTLAGLGVLIFAKHPALRSIALVSITGILSVVIISQVVIPFFFHFLITNRIRKNRMPWTAGGLFKSIFSLTYFAVGSFIVTGFGFILLKLNPFFRSGSRLLYHRMLSNYTWSVLYIMGNVKKKILNPQQEDFSRPAVMIANHQSFLDILVMTMLHPKVVLLTNNWVWNSPVFGKLVRLAGYYPVARGIEHSIGYLETQVAQGYSIAVFPEGTRSPDEEIRRFHKGAFFIAEKLQLDILPILIHGTGYTMSKGDFLLKDGYVTIKYLPRITPDNLYFGVDYTERSKYVGRFFRQQYGKLKTDSEQPRFFRELLLYNYIYKGPVLEWYLRVKTKLEKDYQLFHELLPKQGRILDIGCGYGFLSYMLQFAANNRDLIGYDYDEEKIAVATHCFSRNENLHFITADASRMDVGTADAIVLSDVLHYLNPEQQEILMLKCMKALRKNGVLLIRDGDRDLKQRHQGTKLTEFFSTRLLSFNKTSGRSLHFLSGHSIRALAQNNRMECREIDQTAYTSNLIFVITHTVQSYEKV